MTNIHRSLPLCLLMVCTFAQAERNYLEVSGADGVPLNVVTVGNAEHPAVLLIHGIGQSHASFLRQLDSDLAADLYLVSFDLRGHGNSGKPWEPDAYTETRVWAEDVRAVLEATGAKRPVVVAWSYGTLVVADYIRLFGSRRIAGINLVGAFAAMGPPPPPPDATLMEEFARLRVLQQSPNIEDNIAASSKMVGWLTANPLDDTLRQRFTSVGLMLPVYARRAMGSRNINNRDLVAELDLPILISMGDQDPSTPESGALTLAASLREASVSVYRGVGHSAFLEQPERFNRELRQFVEQNQGPPAVSLDSGNGLAR